jgi:CHASE2 domain-containing sensor protein
MSQRVVLSLGMGDLYSGFPAVTVHLWEGDDPHPSKFVGSLPAAPEIPDLYRSWQLVYEALHYRLDWHPRIEIEAADVTNVSEIEFGKLCQRLTEQINAWLNSESFRSIDQPLRTRLNAADEIRLLIETNDRLLQKLPWHLWHFFDHYPNAEAALSTPEYQRADQVPTPSTGKARILAILGNSRGIDLKQDRAFLERLSSQAEIEFLVEPRREQLNDRLWQRWDMLFFAGHSSSQEQGVIQINPTDSLTLEQLRYALRQAIAQGLKLAVFNSCDGLSLAQQLADLYIPQVIVMREPVPDLVAHTFLKHFLSAFTGGRSLYAAVREARERLQGLEDEFSCASWLPVIYQNPAVAPTAWQDWCGRGEKQGGRGVGGGGEAREDHGRKLKSRISNVLLSSIVVTALVMGVRWLGWLQAWELQAFDHLMRSRPIEQQDQRLLIVAITENDFQLPEQRERKGSLSDLALTKLLDRLEPHQPRAIGLDIYRDLPATPDLAIRLRKSDRFFAICKVRDPANNHPGIAAPPEVPAERQGFSDVLKDPDGILRRHLIAMQPNPASPCTAPYALSAQLALHYLSAEGIAAKFNQDGTLQIGNVSFQRLRSRLAGYQSVDDWGYQILLNYRTSHPNLGIAPMVTLSEVLAGKVKPEQIKDRIVLIGVVAQSAHDYIPTPYSATKEFHEEMPGVVVQAQMLSQLLSAVKDGRPLLTGWALGAEVIWVWSWALMGGVLAIVWRSCCGYRLLLYWVLAIAIALGILYLLCLISLIHGYWIPSIPAALALLGTSSTVTVYFLSRSQVSPLLSNSKMREL